MKVLSVIGPSDAGKTTLIERLTEKLSERGRVGTVKHIHCQPDLDTDGKDTDRHYAAGAVETYGLGDGEWFARGESLTLEDALERLGQNCEYALVEGYTDAALPTVTLGGRESQRGELIASGETVDDIDPETVVQKLDETEPYETLFSLVARAKRSPEQDKSGAIATFTGRVREKEHDDDVSTELLEFEKYDGVAEEKMDRIRDELESRDGVFEVLLHHKTGVVEAGEDIVFVVVLAGHRGEAFRTVQDGINRLKEEVPLFKKEVTVEDEFWAHEA